MGNPVKVGNVFNKGFSGKMLHANPNHRSKIESNDEPGRYEQRTSRGKYGLTSSQLSTDDDDDDSDVFSAQDILPEKPVSALNMGSAHHNIQPKATPLRWPAKRVEDKRTSAPVTKNRRSTVPARSPGKANKYKIPSNLGAERSIGTQETEDLTEVTAISRARRLLEEQRDLEQKKAIKKMPRYGSSDGSGSDQSSSLRQRPKKQVKPRRHTSAGGIAEKKHAARNAMVRKPRKSDHVPVRSSSTGGLADRKKALRQNSSEKSSANTDTSVFATKIRQLRKGIGETRTSAHQAKEPKKTKKAVKETRKSDRDGYSSDGGLAARLRILRGKKEAGGSIVSGKSAKSKRNKTSKSPTRKTAKATKRSPAVEAPPSPKAGEKIHFTSLSSKKKVTKSVDHKKTKRPTPPADLLRNNRSSSDSQLNARERLEDMNKRRSTSNSAESLSPYTPSPETKFKDKSTSAATNPWIALKHTIPPPHLSTGTTRQNTLMAAMTMNSQRAREEASAGSAGSPHPSPKVKKNVVQAGDKFDPWSPVANKRSSLSAQNKWGAALRAQQHKTKDGAALSSLWKDDDNENCAPQMPGRHESDDDDTEFFTENDVFAATSVRKSLSEPAASSADVTNRLERVKKMEKEMSSQQAALEKERASLAFQKESLDIQLRDAILEKDALQQKVKELEKNIGKEVTASPNAVTAADSLKGELEAMKAQIKRIHRETKQVVNDKDKQIRDLQKAASKRQGSQEVSFATSSEGKTRQRLQGELLQANAKLTEKDETVAMQNKRIMELTRELDEATTQNATVRVRKQLEETKKHNDTLKNEMIRKEKDFELKLKSKDEAVAFLIEELTKVQANKYDTTGKTGEMELNDTTDKEAPSDEDLMDNSNHSLGTLLGMAGFALSPGGIRERLASKKIG